MLWKDVLLWSGTEMRIVSTQREAKAMNEMPQFLTVEAFAELFERSAMSVYRGIKLGDIPACRIGNHLRIPKAYVLELERRAMESVSD